MKTVLQTRPRGFTLVEMLTAAVIIGLSMSAAVSLATTLKMQEELSWRATVANNYQEVACRLWQIGQTPADIINLMPGTAGNRPLNDCLDTTVGVSAIAASNKNGLGVLEGITTTLQMANYTASPAGAITTTKVYRPANRGATTP